MTFSLPCLGMTRALRVRQTYDHRLRDAIAATGNADLFRNVAISASTRRTWARLFQKGRVLAQDGVRSSVETGQRPWSKGALLHTTPSSTSEAGVR